MSTLEPPHRREPIALSKQVLFDDLRCKYLPPMVFAGALVAVSVLWSQYVLPKPPADQTPPQPALPAFTNEWPHQ